MMLLGPGLLEGVQGGGFPPAVEGVIMADSTIENIQQPLLAIGCKFFFDTLGQLQSFETGYSSTSVYDGVQWHEDQGGTLDPAANYYGIRATRQSYSGSGDRFIFAFNNLLAAPYSTGTPTPWKQITSFGGNTLDIERSVGSGTGRDTGVAKMEICRWSDKVVLASAIYSISHERP